MYIFQAFPIIPISIPNLKELQFFSNLLSLFAFCSEIPFRQYWASTKNFPHSLEVKCYFVFWFCFCYLQKTRISVWVNNTMSGHKVPKEAKIRKRYNQVQHLAQESKKKYNKHQQQDPRGQLFPSR